MLFVRLYLVDQMCNLRFTTWYNWDEIDAAAFVVRSNGGPARPVYLACQRMNIELAGYHFVDGIKVGIDQDYVLAFENASEVRKVIAWTVDQTAPHDLVISTGGWSGPVAVRDLYGNAVGFTTGSGTITVTVTDSPLYIYLGAKL